MIRSASTDDAAAIAAIYNHYVRATNVTFEEGAVTNAEMAQRIANTRSADLPWLVWADAGKILGYAYASKWKSRCAYRYSVESTVYLDQAATRQGLGSQLYAALIDEVRRQKYHAIIGGIALPNLASVGLHEKFGFQKVAQFREVGWKFEKWIDVGYWELIL